MPAHGEGTAAAKAARKLGLYVLGIRRSGRPHRYVHEMGTTEFLSKWLPRTDFVIVTAPLTPDTEGLLDDYALGRLRPEAGLINLGRARIVDYDALRQRLAAGRCDRCSQTLQTRLRAPETVPVPPPWPPPIQANGSIPAVNCRARSDLPKQSFSGPQSAI